MQTNFKRFAGFTLAEVLITLGIIGVVAALTIPVLMEYSFEREAVSKFKKNYSMLSQAVEKWQTDSGCIGDSSLCPEYAPEFENNVNEVADAIDPYFKYSEKIRATSTAKAQATSWFPEHAYYIDGSTGANDTWLTFLVDKHQGGYGGNDYLLPDGTTMEITGAHHLYVVIIDINGPKPPNRHGKDIFVVSIWGPNHKSINPYAVCGYGWTGVGHICAEQVGYTCNADDGHSPAAYVLEHDKLPDLKAMGYPASP